MQSYAVSTKAALSHETSWYEKTNSYVYEVTGSTLAITPASATQVEEILELESGTVTHRTINDFKGAQNSNSLFYSAQAGTTRGRGSWRYSSSETAKSASENIDKGRNDTYQVAGGAAVVGTTVNVGADNTIINQGNSKEVWYSNSSSPYHQDAKSTSNVGVFNITNIQWGGRTSAFSPNSGNNNTSPASATRYSYTETITSTFSTKNTYSTLKETVQTETSKGAAIATSSTTRSDSSFTRSYFTDKVTKSTATETTTSKTREDGLPTSFIEHVSTSKTYSYNTNIVTSTTFKSTGMSITSSSNWTYTNTACTVETKTKEGQSKPGPWLSTYVVRKGYYQSQPHGPNWGFVIDVKTEVKDFSKDIFSKLKDLTKSIHTTNTKVSVSYELQETKITFTGITHKTSSFTYKGSTFTRNFYNSIPEKTITVHTGTGPAVTSLYSGNYLTFYNYFGTVTLSQVVHYMYSKCIVTTSTEYLKGYTNTYTFLSNLSTTHTELYYDSKGTPKTTSNSINVGFTSSESTFPYSVPVKTSLTQVATNFVFTETQDRIVVSTSSTSNTFSNGVNNHLQGQTKLASHREEVGCTEVPVFISHNKTFLPAYTRPLGESYLLEAFPNAYAGFVATNFSASSIKDYYVTTESSILSGKAPKDYRISNLNYIYLAPNLKGFSKSYIPATAGNYPFTYFDLETTTARTSISLTTSSSTSGSYGFTQVFVNTTTQMGSTNTTCHITTYSSSTYSFSIFTKTTSTALTSSKLRLDGIQTSAIINVVFLTKDNETFETTTRKLTTAPNITQTILIGNTTTSSLLTNSQYDVFTTSSRDTNRLFESTVKVKVNVANRLPNKKFMEAHTLSAYSKVGALGVETSFYSFNGGHNLKGGDYSVYLNKNAITLTEISGTVTRTKSHSALTNISTIVPNGRYFAIAAEPLICQYRTTGGYGAVPEALSFITSISRGSLAAPSGSFSFGPPLP